MGTASYSVGRYAPSRGQAPALLSSDVVAFGAHTTTTSASNIASLSVGYGQVLRVHADEAMRVAVNSTASASNGHYIAAGTTIELECHNAGAVSLIDVA